MNYSSNTDWNSSYGSTMVQLWFNYGSTMVQIWFNYGSNVVQIWFNFVSNMVQIWFKYGSNMVQLWFKYGSTLVQLCFRYGSTMVSNMVQILVQIWFKFRKTLVTWYFYLITKTYSWLNPPLYFKTLLLCCNDIKDGLYKSNVENIGAEFGKWYRVTRPLSHAAINTVQQIYITSL